MPNPESVRLEEDRLKTTEWRRWGPYVSDRAWGTVREDYSADGNAWNYLPHDHARSKAYRWGEDGIGGFTDRYQLLVFAPAFWNGHDPILKERFFGLIPSESNHGEDVKEYYFYLDATPTHSYQKMLYKYPQSEYPYRELIEVSRGRNKHQPEYELLDTGIFDDDRYFDIFIEYAKAGPEDIVVRIQAWNRAKVAADLHVIPQLWFRNRWSWDGKAHVQRPITVGPRAADQSICLIADDSDLPALSSLLVPYQLGKRYLYASDGCRPLFTDNETNAKRLYGPAASNLSEYVKDTFHEHIIHGASGLNPDQCGSKAGLHYYFPKIGPGECKELYFRLTNEVLAKPLQDAAGIVETRRQEADAFYASLHPAKATADEKNIQRQALAGMIWCKQSYLFNVAKWQAGDNPDWPPPASHSTSRNVHWPHLNSMRILTMPDKWEYPWFAAWDLALHTVTFAIFDPEFAKEQLWLLLFEQFQHPNGQIPAYEWEFSDLNPPVHAWAVWRVYNMERIRYGRADRTFLEKCFHKLLMNFAWWVNKVDVEGNNVFEGGFLGLDNITVFDRSSSIEDGARLLQSDSTGWMGMFCLNLMRIALELAKENKAYLGLATKFFQHYVYIGAALNRRGDHGFELWSESEGFFYDVLTLADGQYNKFRVRSLVGLIPLFAIERLEEKWLELFPEFRLDVEWFLKNHAEIASRCVTLLTRGDERVLVLSLMTEQQLRRVLSYVAEPEEFLSPYGLRSLSKHHKEHPFQFCNLKVDYEPGEAISTIKGGNSNWRGPIWFPTTFLLIESMRKLAKAYGSEYLIPAGRDTDKLTTFGDLSRTLAEGLIRIFKKQSDGSRPVHAQREKFQNDPHWREYLLFYEYFHGDTGEGLGASHQTGWTGLVASLIDEWR